MNVDENLTTADYNEPLTPESDAAAAPVPTHLYAIKDDDRYGYVTAVSEDDQKQGKAAGDVIFFVYRGRDRNTYKLDQVTASGVVVETTECQRPCTAIKRYRYGDVSYVGFEPTSIIGSAYTDAFNGFLQASPLPKAREESLPSYAPATASVPTLESNSEQINTANFSEDNSNVD
jgi:hypothetical protein